MKLHYDEQEYSRCWSKLFVDLEKYIKDNDIPMVFIGSNYGIQEDFLDVDDMVKFEDYLADRKKHYDEVKAFLENLEQPDEQYQAIFDYCKLFTKLDVIEYEQWAKDNQGLVIDDNDRWWDEKLYIDSI